MAVDLRRGRPFVAEPGNGSVDAIDLATGKAVRRFAGLKEPQGVGYVRTGATVAGLATCGDADNVFFDPARRRLKSAAARVRLMSCNGRSDSLCVLGVDHWQLGWQAAACRRTWDGPSDPI